MLSWLVVTTWTLVLMFQTDAGIKRQYQPGITTEQKCDARGKAWLRKQPHKFDWFYAYNCEPTYILEPADKGNAIVSRERLSTHG